jgi:arginase family enzyme
MKIFGIALDPINSLERLSLKLSYLNYIKNTPWEENRYLDPYDVIKDYLKNKSLLINDRSWAGKISVESWLAPKPNQTDFFSLTPDKYRKFLENNGCFEYAMIVRDYLKEKIFPAKPVMIGVDHGLTGGVVKALSERFNNLNVVIFDAHFDVMRYQVASEKSAWGITDAYNGNSFFKTEEAIQFYECGNFISFLLERNIIKPERLWILGVQEEVVKGLEKEYFSSKAEWSQVEEFRKWVDKGVHLITKNELVSKKSINLSLNGPTYLSIDMDVGSLSSIYSARFMNCIGVTYNEFVNALYNLSCIIRESDIPLIGLDLMEIDIHLLEASGLSGYKDYTKEIIKKIFQFFLNDLEEDLAS